MATVGDLYLHRTDDTDIAPIALVSDVMQEDDRVKLMEAKRRDVSLPTSSGTQVYEMDASAVILGAVSSELRAQGVRKYRVKVVNPREYELSQVAFRKEIEDHFRNEMPGESIDNTHYVYSLLEVDGVEYEFLNENGRQIHVEPTDEIAQVVKGHAKMGWEFSEDGKLVGTESRFIGYRTHQIQECTHGQGLDGDHVSIWVGTGAYGEDPGKNSKSFLKRLFD